MRRRPGGLARVTGTLLLGLVAAGLVVFALAPFEWMLMTGLKPGDTNLVRGNPWLPDHVTAANFIALAGSARFWGWMLNTTLVLAGSLGIALVVASLAALGLTLIPLRWAPRLILGFFLTYALPQAVLFLPLLNLLHRLRLTNSIGALIVTYPGLVVPFAIWAIWSVLSAAPVRALIEQATLDGAGPAATLVNVLLPVLAPTLAAVTLFGIAIVFGDQIYASTFITDPTRNTLPGAFAANLVDLDDPGFFFAATVAGLGPIALVAAYFAERTAGRLAGLPAGSA